MREISFRGKALQGGEWQYGDYMSYAGGAQIWTHDPDGGTHNVLVDQATVGQYTGLKDRNEKKIFEGNIVAFEDAVADYEGYHDNVFINRAVVKYDEYSWALCGNISVVTMDDLVYKGEFDGEVIGNVYDNPELESGTVLYDFYPDTPPRKAGDIMQETTERMVVMGSGGNGIRTGRPRPIS